MLGNQLHDPGALKPWKELPYPLGKRLGKPPNQFGCFGEAKSHYTGYAIPVLKHYRLKH